MSSFENNGITAKGNNLIAKVVAGKTKLNYTKAVVGDGTLGNGQAIISLTNLISPKDTFNINRLVATPGDPAWATVGFVYSNQGVTSSYFLREIGIFATDPDEGEILYWYGNSGATADFIKPGDGTGSDIIEKKFDIGIYVGQSANVTATIDGSLIFPTYDEFDAAITAARAYTDQKFSSIVIEAASTTKAGVTKLNNSTNSTSQTEASTPYATKTAMDKALQAVADAATAQSRAEAAERNAKNASLPLTGGTVSGALRVNGEMTFADGSTFSQLKQSGVDAKKGIVDAINAMGGSASTNDSWSVLFSKVRALKTPMKRRVITGIGQSSSQNQNNNYTVNNLDFVPKVIEVELSYNSQYNGNILSVTSLMIADRNSGTTEFKNSEVGTSRTSWSEAVFTNNSISIAVTAVDYSSTGLLTTTIRSIRIYGD